MAANSNKISDLLAEVFTRGGMKRAIKRAESVLLWSQVVGPDVANFTEAKALKEGILYVEVTDSETSMHLSLQRQRFLDVYRGRFKVRDISDIRFVVGRPRVAEEPPPPPPPTPVDPKDLAEIAKHIGNLELSESLTQQTMQAAKAMLAYKQKRIAEGWQTCELCETLTEEKTLCTICERYMGDAKVMRASQVLAADPEAKTPYLSDDERSAAIYLAKAQLHERLHELLPYVLADASYKPELETVAHCYAAHMLGKTLADISQEDLDILDSRVARALGRWR